MINAQVWLDWNYPNKNQVETIYFYKHLDFDQPDELIIDNYPNLKEIKKDYYYNIPNLTKLTISNCPQLEKVDIYNFKNNQQLILNNLPNLKSLDCSDNNKLTTLDLSDCDNLQRIYCHNNQLTEIKLPQGKKLEVLDLRNNKFNQDLSFLSHLVNLNKLYLGSNKFKGSLESLRNMSKLGILNIRDTYIDSGLEYLPDSLKEFRCSADKRKNAKLFIFYLPMTKEK